MNDLAIPVAPKTSSLSASDSIFASIVLYDTFDIPPGYPGLEVGRRVLCAYLVDPNNPSTYIQITQVLSYTDGMDWVYKSVTFSGLTPGSTYKVAIGRGDCWYQDWSLTSEWAAVKISAPQSDGYYYSNILKTADYGFNIPSTATIKGIKVEFKCYATASGTQVAVNQLYKASGTICQGSTGATLPTTLGWISYGGPGDLWGATWSPSDVNDNGFGLGLAFSMLSGGVYLDTVKITVYYTSPPSGTPNTQTFPIISYRSNSTSYCVRISTVALFANGTYQSCATLLNYGSAQFNTTHSVGDCLIFNFTHTLSQHYSLIADALSNIVNNTYAPLAQQNQTAYQLVIAYTALSEHAGRLADFTVAHLQAYNRQIIQATVLATDPPNYGEGVIWDDYIPLRGGGVVPTGGSDVPPTYCAQGVVSMPTSYVFVKLDWSEPGTFLMNFIMLVSLCFVPAVGMVQIKAGDFVSIFVPLFMNSLPTFVTMSGLVVKGQIGWGDFGLAMIGLVIAIATAVVDYYSRDKGFWQRLAIFFAAKLPFLGLIASMVGFAIALTAFIIGVIWLLITLLIDCTDD